MSDLERRLHGCFAAVFPALPPASIPAASMESVAQWDSITHVTLVEVIQQDFGVTIDDDDVERLTSYGAWLERLRS